MHAMLGCDEFLATPSMKIAVYLADQNPHRDRSLGITGMTDLLLAGLSNQADLKLVTLTSKSSYSFASKEVQTIQLPFRTDRTLSRLAADHLHPWMLGGRLDADIIHYPKGYLPFLSWMEGKRVITVYDTIVQHYADHYPRFRSSWDYLYWTRLLESSLREADMILTASHAARGQILKFCERYGIARREIHVTSAASHHEDLNPATISEKEDYVLHLASIEPHKKTLHLLQWWKALEREGKNLPALKLVGTLSDEALQVVRDLRNVMVHHRLQRAELVESVRKSRGLLLPSEIEGFGLPALEAYFLGTPVCFVKGTSVDEFVSAATSKGGFDLDHQDSFRGALDEVLGMKMEEVLRAGEVLRKNHSRKKYIETMLQGFRRCAGISA